MKWFSSNTAVISIALELNILLNIINIHASRSNKECTVTRQTFCFLIKFNGSVLVIDIIKTIVLPPILELIINNNSRKISKNYLLKSSI